MDQILAAIRRVGLLGFVIVADVVAEPVGGERPAPSRDQRVARPEVMGAVVEDQASRRAPTGA